MSYLRQNHNRLGLSDNWAIVILAFILLGGMTIVAVSENITNSIQSNSSVQEQYAKAYDFNYEPPINVTFGEFILSLMIVEGGFNPDNSFEPESIGPLQITEPYWIDSGIDHPYAKAYDVQLSIDAAYAYFDRYNSRALQKRDWETLARLHNGGPSMQGTDDYWQKVQNAMEVVIDLR